MLFYYRQQLEAQEHGTIVPDGLKIKKCFPHAYVLGMFRMQIGRKRIIYYFILTLIYSLSRRCFVEYDLLQDGKIISKAVCCSKVPEYAFMPSDGVHLGYCETIKEKQNRGYYTLLLKMIQKDFPRRNLYMIVDESNVPSIRGVESAGFVKFAKGIKRDNRFVLI